MLQLTLKNLRANKIRFALTTFGVMLAVSFVVSAFVLGDGLRSTFGDIAEETTAGIDLQVRPEADFGDPPPLPEAHLAAVLAVEGVADAVPGIEAGWDVIQLLGNDGTPVTGRDAPPHIGYTWSDNTELSAFALVEGTSPDLGQFTVDLDSAAKHELVFGDSYDFSTPNGPVSLELVGTSTFGADNGTAGAILLQMNVAEAGAIFGVDGFNTIDVQVQDSADVDTVQEALSAVVPGAEVVDNDTISAEAKEEFTGQINIIGNILLGFGGVALFVSIFIIYNTFAIVLGQRTRELALLRTIGADARQIQQSVLGEALVIGALASGGGIVGGVGVSKGLEALFNATGGSLPDSPTIVATRTIVAAVVIGVGVTLMAAIGPARRAGSVPAIAALRGGAEASDPGSRTRILSGLGLVGVGALSGLGGLSGAGGTATTVALMAIGAIGVFLGVTVLSPMSVNIVTRVLGWPLAKISGVAGRLAQQNAARNARRTATTAAALMIGLALVSTVMIVGESVKATIGTTLEQSATADYYLTDQFEEVTFPLTLDAELVATDAFDSAVGFRYVETRVAGEIGTNVAANFDSVEGVLNADVREGGFDRTVENPVLVAAGHAEAENLGLGDVVATEFANGVTLDSTIVGVFHDEALIVSDFLFDEATFDAAGDTTGYEWLAVGVADGASESSIELAVAELVGTFPLADIETTSEFRARADAMIDDVLAMVNIMVALAVIIALIGIANTLALSVFERTRELGLVRAVGMTKRQLRRMVRFEAALVATFGAVLGVAIGLVFGWSVVRALPASLASNVAIPVSGIAMLVVVAAFAGVLAAVLPARRAGALNVLDAISH